MSSGPTLHRDSGPRKRRGRPPKSLTSDDPAQSFYPKHRKQEVLLYLINHRFEDFDGRGAELAAAGVEARPHRLPDGKEKWFRGPSFAEAAAAWNIPSATIARWWDIKEVVFDGAVPSSLPPLIKPARAWRNQFAPPSPSPPSPVVAATPPVGPGPRLVYPQAVVPSGPPMHPLYRANFALGEVSKELAHMLQNQQNLYLENLLRAIALSQALVNDLNEAHTVLLNPQSYPHYYPPAQSQPPPPPPIPTPPPALSVALGPMPRTPDGRYLVIQPAQQAQQAGQGQWLLGTGAGSFTSTRPSSLRQAARAFDAGRKRSYASKNGPGATAEQPIGLEDDDAGASNRESTAGREKRRDTAGGTGQIEDTAATGHQAETHTANDVDGRQAAAQSSVTLQDATIGSMQNHGNESNAHSGKEIDASSAHQGLVPEEAESRESEARGSDAMEPDATVSGPEQAEAEDPVSAGPEATEPESSEAEAAKPQPEQPEDPSGTADDGNAQRIHSIDEELQQQIADNEAEVREEENGAANDSSPDTATEPEGGAEREVSLFVDHVDSSTDSNESGVDEDIEPEQPVKIPRNRPETASLERMQDIA